MKVAVRNTSPADHPQLASLYAAAFPKEDLLPLVDAMLMDSCCLASLVAVEQETVVGHALVTACSVPQSPARLALLGPLAVLPALQRRGIGTALVREALHQMVAAEINRILVLGDPAYYHRFGFAPERDVEPALPIPPAWRTAWQSLPLPGAESSPVGTLSVPSPWRDPSLWAP